jgi:hypothetical protein
LALAKLSGEEDGGNPGATEVPAVCIKRGAGGVKRFSLIWIKTILRQNAEWLSKVLKHS